MRLHPSAPLAKSPSSSTHSTNPHNLPGPPTTALFPPNHAPPSLPPPPASNPFSIRPPPQKLSLPRQGSAVRRGIPKTLQATCRSNSLSLSSAPPRHACRATTSCTPSTACTSATGWQIKQFQGGLGLLRKSGGSDSTGGEKNQFNWCYFKLVLRRPLT